MLNNGVGSNGVACVRLVNQTKQSSRVYLWEYGITAISQHQHPPANILSSHPNQNTQTTHKIGGGDQTLSAPNESVSSRSGNVSKMLCVCLAFHVGMRKAGLFMAQLHYIKSHPAASLPRRHVEKKQDDGESCVCLSLQRADTVRGWCWDYTHDHYRKKNRSLPLTS